MSLEPWIQNEMKWHVMKECLIKLANENSKITFTTI